jgi:hypothetical protein
MRHHGSIAGVALESDSELIVYGPCLGLVAECKDLAEAKRALEAKLAELKEYNCPSDLAIFRWSEGSWTAALSAYEMQEWELQKNPSRVIDFP